MSRLYSYPDVYAIGHKAIQGIFDDPVLVEEKIDGSQFSMGIIDGELACRSKGQQIELGAPDNMFAEAAELAKALPLMPGWLYRGEWLTKPKHNTLVYARRPERGLILFDIQTGLEEYMPWADKHKEAARLGLGFVPVLFEGVVVDFDAMKELLKTPSCLGGCLVEGIVVKNYSRFTNDKKAMMGKYVSEAFKEVHEGDWKKRNPTQGDILQSLIMRYKTVPRWEKAIQHLRDAGQLEGSPRDIGGLMHEIPMDIRKECEDEIKGALFAHFWPHISRAVTAGLPEWYKDRLAQGAFSNDSQEMESKD